jgi:hypothetical protein
MTHHNGIEGVLWEIAAPHIQELSRWSFDIKLRISNLFLGKTSQGF